MTKSSFKRKTYSFNDILELVHNKICGPIRVERYCGDKYFNIIVDDYSRMIIVMFLKEKYDAFQLFKLYLTRFEKKIGKKLMCLRFNRGGEFILNQFNIYFNDR